MSRKLILSLAAAATFAVAGLASSSTYAHGLSGSGRGRMMTTHLGGSSFSRGSVKLARNPRLNLHPIKPILPIVPIHFHPHWHHPHMHWVFRDGGWIEIGDVVVDAAPVDVAPASVPGPCTCLTKTYTPDGLVVFADVCTKESASAPATDDHADASKTPTSTVPATATPIAQVPTAPNYAGRSYADYLAANPQTAQPQASSQAPQQDSQAPQQN